MGMAGGGKGGASTGAMGEPYQNLMTQFPKTFGFDPNILGLQKGGSNDSAHFYDVGNQFKTNTVTFNPTLTNANELKRSSDPAAGIKGEMISLAKGDAPVFGYFKGNDTYVDIKTGKAVDKYAVQSLMGSGPVNQFRPGSGGKPIIYNYEDSFDETKFGSASTTGSSTTTGGVTPTSSGGAVASDGTIVDPNQLTELEKRKQMQSGQVATTGAATVQKISLLGS